MTPHKMEIRVGANFSEPTGASLFRVMQDYFEDGGESYSVVLLPFYQSINCHISEE